MKDSEVGGIIAADIGGTFTDMLFAERGHLRSVKIPSSPPRFGMAISEGVKLLLGVEQVSETNRFDTFLHGATVATNALLEGTGARTALVTTRGFRDVLEIGRSKRPSVLSVRWRKSPPLVDRHLRFELDERVAADGSIVRPCSEAEVRALAEQLRSEAVEAVAICLINSYVNPDHEIMTAAILRDELPGVFISASSEIVPELSEYERTSTTVVNGFIGPVVGNYIAEIQRDIDAFRPGSRFRIMQSNGGLIGPEGARAEPVRLVESGPAAGVTAATLVARTMGESRLLAFDMGGTTAKVALVEDYRAAEVMEFQVGAGMNTSESGGGGGYPIRVPSVDIVEVGAGGGSIFWMDAAGQPHVGPQSAGANPGPVCYGRGGQALTVTDANLVLGYLNPSEIAGGSQKMDRESALRATEEQAARPLGVSALDAAHGIYRLVNSNMSRALRAASVERGRDPRDYCMVAFGGAGPMHAAAIAQSFGVSKVIIPPMPGLFSALGLLVAETRHDHVRPCPHPRPGEGWASANHRFEELRQRAVGGLVADGIDAATATFKRYLDLRYQGQTLTLTIELDEGDDELDDASFERAAGRFEAEYRTTFGHALAPENVQLVGIRVRAVGVVTSEFEDALRLAVRDDTGATASTRRAYFGREYGEADVPVLPRPAVPSDFLDGPMIVEGEDSTIVVPPGCRIRLDDLGNVIIDTSVGR